jgi:hypothetical protein
MPVCVNILFLPVSLNRENPKISEIQPYLLLIHAAHTPTVAFNVTYDRNGRVLGAISTLVPNIFPFYEYIFNF